MEVPVALKLKSQSKKQPGSKDGGGRVCIIHFPSTDDESIKTLTQCKLKETAAKRLKLSDDDRSSYKFQTT